MTSDLLPFGGQRSCGGLRRRHPIASGFLQLQMLAAEPTDLRAAVQRPSVNEQSETIDRYQSRLLIADQPVDAVASNHLKRIRARREGVGLRVDVNT